MTPGTITTGDNLEVLKGWPAECVDSVVTDPPYGLSFMGKSWDYDVPSVEQWAEVLRVLKPGGHLLSFAGTRTQHRMAVAIEDAGFEIRDMLAWVYGSGFAKGFNTHRMEACNYSGKPLPCTHDKETPKHEMPSVRNPDLPPTEYDGEERNDCLLPSMFQSDEGSILPSHSRGGGEESRENDGGKQPSVEGRQLHRAGQGLSDGEKAGAPEGETERLRAGTYPSDGGDAGAITDGGGRGAPHQPREGGQSPGESETLCEPPGALDGAPHGGRAQCPRCGGLKEEWQGFSSNLKPALEPITLARKPISGTIAANVLEHGTGALNVDGCRVGTDDVYSYPNGAGGSSFTVGGGIDGTRTDTPTMNTKGRFPANLIHDGSPEVIALFPETGASKSGGVAGWQKGGYVGGKYDPIERTGYDDNGGSAARFFYCAKAPGTEREDGNHPTVKPLALMRYLVRLVTPPGGVVLDPWAGSGTTLAAADEEGFQWAGIELDPEHAETCRARIAATQPGLGI